MPILNPDLTPRTGVAYQIEKPYKEVIYEKDKDNPEIVRITLNRPEKLNTWSQRMSDEFYYGALVEAQNDDEVKVVIIKGAGRCFSAGFYLEEIPPSWYARRGEPPKNQRDKILMHRELNLDQHMKLLTHPKLTIAQVHGYAIGEGLVVMELCDMAVAADSALIGHSEQRLGHGGQEPSMALVMMSIGLRRAVELFITGRKVDGKEAERIGWVNFSVPEDKLEDETARLAKACSLMPHDSIAIGKQFRHMLYERLGIFSSLWHTQVMHPMFTNMRLAPGEFRFLHTAGEKGLRAAIHDRDDRYAELGF